jgi:hypothetical protein
MPKTSTKATIIVLSILSMFGIIILSAALYAHNRPGQLGKIIVGEKHSDGCADSMAIIVVDASNEHYTCQEPSQKIEVYPAGVTRYGGPMTLIKCICGR